MRSQSKREKLTVLCPKATKSNSLMAQGGNNYTASRYTCYDTSMIQSFADDETRQIFLTGKSRKFGTAAKTAARKLQLVDYAKKLDDLKQPPGNRLEKLRGSREGQYSIRVNDQFRICFRWADEDAWDVEVVDYHQE